MNDFMSKIIVDYIPAKECKNEEMYCICLKCGMCGRVFNEHGFMIDDGGTHPDIEEEE